MNQAEIEIMKERIQYFSDKKISDLSEREIEEFLALRKYVRVNMIQRAVEGYYEKLGIK
ncbi:hypothetical protein [Salimicrobium jeotgali]|uniref:hypothetical protein n=1 Tax=Salimicrobium jeotgali TaxID=1230341 RepID=UPI00030BCD6C|nr:hypothetical protein [Salimicrobium jeotgali]MBM7696617.1 hypothetical protein [Salimicrobium jeotgali]